MICQLSLLITVHVMVAVHCELTQSGSVTVNKALPLLGDQVTIKGWALSQFPGPRDWSLAANPAFSLVEIEFVAINIDRELETGFQDFCL